LGRDRDRRREKDGGLKIVVEEKTGAGMAGLPLWQGGFVGGDDCGL
jgi:hypothetical protein